MTPVQEDKQPNQSPVLNPKPCGTFLQPTSESPFTLSFPHGLALSCTVSLSPALSPSQVLHPLKLLYLAFLLPKLCGQGSPLSTPKYMRLRFSTAAVPLF